MTGVSVVVPTRNRGGLLTTTLRSVLWQRDVDLEVIVVDEASTDDTAEIVARLADPRVAMVRNEVPEGPSLARNRGARRARREWVAFVDDDDLWAPDKLASQVGAVERAGRDWAYVGAANIGSDLEIVSGRPPPPPDEVVAALPRYNPIPAGGSNVILRRRLFAEVGGFDQRFPPCEDWELWLRLSRSGPPAFVSRPLIGYRVHGGGSSLDTGRIRRSARLIEQVHGTQVDWGRMHRWLAESCLRTERHVRALGHFARAALGGQARGVASDLAAIVRRRGYRRGGGQDRQEAPSVGAWLAEASAWLRELEGLPPHTGAEEVGPP